MKRSEIDSKYKWNLSRIYEKDEMWEQDFTKLKEILPSFQDLKQNITKSAKNLAHVLTKLDEASLLRDKLLFYAYVHRDENNADSTYQAMTDRAISLSVEMSSETSFVAPSLLKEDKAKLERFITQEPALSDYTFMIRNIVRKQKYVLSESEEKLLSLSEDFASGASEIYSMLCDVDMKLGSIVKDSEEVKLTHAKFLELMQNRDRQVRKVTFKTYYESYKNNINTIAAAYSTSVKKDVFYAKVRGCNSALSSALFEDNVSEKLYDKLISVVHDNLNILHDYIETRCKILSLDEMGMYDIYVPLVAEVNKKYSYEQAIDMVIEGLKPMGEEYLGLLKRARDEGWIDVFESENKTSGAFSGGVYGTHPYVMLNYSGDLDSISTIAHELGHAMHTYYSNENQPYAKAEYTIFVAEVASTVNEILLILHMLDTTDGDLRKCILNHYLDEFRILVCRSTMFAEFEKATHAMCEAGEPLTQESLSAKYAELNRTYHGDVMKTCDTIALEWARIPHFYGDFYVYKYATGFSAAVMIANGIYHQKPGVLEAYKEFLKSGGSDYPLELLKKAGVDFIYGNPIENCMEAFAQALLEFKAEMGV